MVIIRKHLLRPNLAKLIQLSSHPSHLRLRFCNLSLTFYPTPIKQSGHLEIQTSQSYIFYMQTKYIHIIKSNDFLSQTLSLDFPISTCKPLKLYNFKTLSFEYFV